MKEIKLVIKEELFERIAVEVGQVNWFIDNDDFKLYGSVTSDGHELGEYSLQLKANFCKADGAILYIVNSDDIHLDKVNYDSFTLSAYYLSHHMDIEELNYIEIYPTCTKKNDYMD